jgi:dUTP pyrophosphatase
MELLVKLIYLDAIPPTKKRREDAGWDLHAQFDVKLLPGHTLPLDCGIAIWVPDGFAGLIFPRSSWRSKGLVCHSVYDHGYTGLTQPFITNSSSEVIEIEKGERVLQFLFVPVLLGGRIRIVSELPASDRGGDGVGSTGKF